MVGKRVVTPRLESSKGDKRRKTNNTIARSPPPPPAISLCLVYGPTGFINLKCSGDFENGKRAADIYTIIIIITFAVLQFHKLPKEMFVVLLWSSVSAW